MRPFRTWFSRRARRPERTILRLFRLDDRDMPAVGFTAAGAAAGTAPLVTVFRPDGTTLAHFAAYDASFLGGVNVAVGEIDGNPLTADVVTGAGPGGGPHVKVFTVNTTTGAVSTLASFMAYDPAFAGGVHVAVGKFGGTNVDDVVTAAGPGGGPHVRVFSIGADGTASQISSPLGSFMAFDPTFGGGVNVAAGNVNGNTVDGDELVVAAGPGGGPHVRVLDAIGNEVAGFMAFDPTFNGGVSIGAITANQLLVDSLSGGGVTQFMLGPGGAITPFVITPINISAAATALGLLGVDPALVNGFTPLTSDFAFGPNGPVLLNQITGLPIGIDPFFTSLGTIGTDAALLGTPTTSLAPNFNNVNLNTVTPAQVAALNGAIFPGLDLMTTNPLVANLALPPV